MTKMVLFILFLIKPEINKPIKTRVKMRKKHHAAYVMETLIMIMINLSQKSASTHGIKTV